MYLKDYFRSLVLASKKQFWKWIIMISLFKILYKGTHCNFDFPYCSQLLKMSLEYNRFQRENHITNSFQKIIEYILIF